MQPFYKVIPPGSYDHGESPLRLVKVAARGLVGADLRALVKRAGYQFAAQIKKADLRPGDVAAHLIAMGATEWSGLNRNFDGFKEAMLRRTHPTFVKFARAFRNHDNKDPARSYGYVKHSWYNPDMHRVELLTVYNGTQEAADRNGGLVADRECDFLEKGADFPVSMSIKVPYDECTGCGHQARTRAEYCEDVASGGTCKYGGLKYNIGRVINKDDDPILGADNPAGTFFDISEVGKGADRTAFAIGKVAGLAGGRGGAALAEAWNVTAPAHVLALDTAAGPAIELAVKLAGYEREPLGHPWPLAFAPQVRPAVPCHPPGGKVGQALTALAAHRVCLPVRGFLELVGVDPEKAAGLAPAVEAALPGVFGRLTRAADFAATLAASPFRTTEPASQDMRYWAAKRAAAYGLDPDTAAERAALAAVRGAAPPAEKSQEKSAGPAAAELAKTYALYQLGFLEAAGPGPGDLTARLTVLQNQV